jgi:hypothetical protein
MANKTYYVYEWYIVESGEVFYVGKGCDNRVTSMKNRNKYFKNIRAKHECGYRILADNLAEQEAYDLELSYGLKLKESGQAKASYALGGKEKYISNETREKISSTLKAKKNHAPRGPLTEEHRNKIAASLTGKAASAETRKKMSQSRNGHAVSEETKLKLSASKTGDKNPQFGKKQTDEVIRKRTQKLIGHEVSQETREKIGKSNGKPVMQYSFDGKIIAVYQSASEAARSTGLQFSHISAVCNGRRKTCGGFKWEYIKHGNTEVTE